MDVLYLRTFFPGPFVTTDDLSPRMFCHHGCFVTTDVLSLRTFWHRTFWLSRCYVTDVLSPDVLSPDVLSQDVLSVCSRSCSCKFTYFVHVDVYVHLCRLKNQFFVWPDNNIVLVILNSLAGWEHWCCHPAGWQRECCHLAGWKRRCCHLAGW